MNDKTSSLLDVATRDLDPDIDALVAGGVARGRARRRRRTAGTALVAAAVAGIAGLGVVASLSGADGTHAEDLSVATSPGSSASVVRTNTAPRDLAMRAAGVPELFASIFPGEVAIIPGKENPMDGFDPRSQPLGGGPTDRKGEPGPGVIADFTWNGYYVRAAVAPSDPAFGDTAGERCRGEASSDTGCEDVAGGGALVSSTMVNPPVDGTTTVRFVKYYTPDLWTVTLMVSNGATSRDHVLTPQPPFTLAELTAAATSDAWFD
ncbi:hypothetical protein [Nocardioides sp.]|uniref:hypothetical protein n=1 Tax=Nocardioides sp. TaxID=35761 RepID=UPI0031FE83BA|nr:hypothetical protein [Nocardioides sp.]